MSTGTLLMLALLLFLLLAYLARSAIYIIRPYEQGLYERLGSFRGTLNPGFNIVSPLISRVIKMDLRTQPLDVPAQEVITKDNAPTRVDAIIYIKVIDPKKAFYEVQHYRKATVYLAQTTLRSVIGDMELDEIFYNRNRINTHLRDILDEATDAWGVKVENVEIREVEPVPRVKQAMEEQTSAERERRAAIRRADGEKRAAILKAEGGKRSRILQAEGLRQAKILEAEGQRLATILESQGEAQKLRILAMGSLPLDSKALTVLSLDTLKSVGNGQATKIIFPFELSKLVQGAADYLGSGSETIKEHTPMSAPDMERLVGKADDVLGEIPKHNELKKELDQIEKDMELISTESLAPASSKDKFPSKEEEEK